MNKNFKKLFTILLSALNLLALTPHAFCARTRHPLATSTTIHHTKNFFKNYTFTKPGNFKYDVTHRKDIKSAKINSIRNGIISVSLSYLEGHDKEFYFNILELSLNQLGTFRISMGIKIFNSCVAKPLSIPPISEKDLRGFLILPERTTLIIPESFKNINNVDLISIPKHTKIKPYFCNPNIKIVTQ